MKKTRILIVCLLAGSLAASGQEAEGTRWTLRDCLDYAMENNIQIQRSKVAYTSGLEDTEQARAALFPSLTASVTQGFVNYPSSRVLDNNSYSGNYSLTANWTLFNGGQRRQELKQQKLRNTIDELAVEESANDIRLSLIQAYMQVLYAMESVRINEHTVEVSKAQRDRAVELLAAGSISRVDLAQLESQLSSDEYQLVVSQTTLDNYRLQLKQLLELDITQEIALELPELTEEDILAPLPEKTAVYATSLAVMPEIAGGQLEVDVAELEIKRAKGAYWPTLSLNAGIGTGHLSGTDYTFGTQMWDKFNESVGLTLSIPIFSNRQYKTAYNKAKLARITSELDLRDREKQLLSEVEGVYLDALSAQNQYTSATERLEYATESYRLTEEQFNLGMKNTVELLTEKNNYLTAQQEQLQAKYMSLMSAQLLNVYQDKPIDETL